MARKQDFIGDLFVEVVKAPWWAGVSLALITFGTTHFIIPNMEFESWVHQGLAKGAPFTGKMFSLLFLLCGFLSAFDSWTKRKQLDTQTGINSIRALSWKRFEELVGEAYRRLGYKVLENVGSGPDGGVDLTLKKDDQLILVQCKHWKSRKVGVNIVRELLGVITSSKAHQGIIVTCGAFTPQAKDFAHGNPIKLIEGNELVALIGSVQREPVVQSISKSIEMPICPKCGSKMVKRTARRGENAGNLFWGCSNFPKCRSIVAYNQ